MNAPYARRALVIAVLSVAAVLSGVTLIFHSSAHKPPVGVKSIVQEAPPAMLGASVSGTSATPFTSGQDEASQGVAVPPSTTVAKPTDKTQQADTQPAPPNNPAPTSSQSGEQIINIHIGGFPPAVGASLTDFINPTHVPCSGAQLKNPNCGYNSYQWEETKYCVFTYADNHTQKQAYQYLAYGDIYANSDGTLNPSGINMAVTSNPTYTCNVASAPKSVFEPSYTY